MKKRIKFSTFSTLRGVSCVAAAIGLLLVATEDGWTQTPVYIYNKVADTSTPIPPGGSGNFSIFSVAPPISETNTVFFGTNTVGTQKGIYLFTSNNVSSALVNVADQNTTIPGRPEKFVLFGGTPAISGTNVVFFGGTNSAFEGIYLSSGSGLSLVASKNPTNAIPGGVNNFTFLSDPFAISGTSVTFWGSSNGILGVGGIYRFSGGSLTNVADANTTVPSTPSTTNKFTVFGATPSISGTDVIFFGGTNLLGGIYRFSGTSLTNLADGTTPVPSGTGNFVGFGSTLVTDSGNVTFFGTNSTGGSGIYLFSSGSLTKVLDQSTPIFNGTTLSTVGPRSISGANVAFWGTNAFGKGIFLFSGGSLTTVADQNTAIPGGSGTFADFGTTPSISGANVAFYGTNSTGGGGIYLFSSGVLNKVISHTDSLDGKTLNASTVASPGLIFGSKALTKDVITFLANFTDGSAGYFIAIPTSTILATPTPGKTIPATTIPASGIPATTTPATTTPATTTPATTTPGTTTTSKTTGATTIPGTSTPATTANPGK